MVLDFATISLKKIKNKKRSKPTIKRVKSGSIQRCVRSAFELFYCWFEECEALDSHSECRLMCARTEGNSNQGVYCFTSIQ